MASKDPLVVGHDLLFNTLPELDFLDSFTELFKVLFLINVQTLNFANIAVFEFLIDPGMIFGSCHDENRVDSELLFFHFLMMTSALMGISGFDKDCHEIKDVIEPSFGPDLESLLKIFNKHRIFKFLFFGPMAFLLVCNQLSVGLSSNKKGHYWLFVDFLIHFLAFFLNLS